MASITIRNLDDDIKEKLRVRAAVHGRSMEAEVRDILRGAVIDPPIGKTQTLGDLARELFGPENGFDIAPYLPERKPGREPPDFS